MTDGELLRRYACDRSESAFEELVRRHIDLVHSAALRQVNGDTQEAEDVTQSVFTDLARKAANRAGSASLASWLYTSTRFHAANARRTVSRRRVREQEAHAMNALLQSPDPEPDWAQVRPLLDEAMHALDEPDREAVLLRHFERRSYAEIGSQLGLTENAARMRVERALDKLHASLARHGITSTALALAGLLAANAAAAAPAHLAAKVAGAAVAATAAEAREGPQLRSGPDRSMVGHWSGAGTNLRRRGRPGPKGCPPAQPQTQSTRAYESPIYSQQRKKGQYRRLPKPVRLVPPGAGFAP